MRREPGHLLVQPDQQRAALGRALAIEPRVLLLDEPLSNLDTKLREAMRAELKLIQRRTGLPILYVTHDQVEALSMSDRIAVMSAGRIHHLGPPEDIYDHPATRFVLDFIGAVNHLPCTVLRRADGRLRLALGGGVTEIEAPHPPQGTGEMALAVRPEDVQIATCRPDALTMDAPRARILLRAFVGDGFEYRLDLQGLILRARTDKTLRLDEGTEVTLTLRRAVLLDADAGPESALTR